VRLSDSVEARDVEQAHKLLCFALYHDQEPEDDDEGSEAEADLSEEEASPRKRKTSTGAAGGSDGTFGSPATKKSKSKQARHRPAAVESSESASSRFETFKKVFSKCGGSDQDEGIHIRLIVEAFEPHSSHKGDLAAVQVEAEEMLRRLEKTDAVMGDEDKVTWYRI